MQEQYYKRNCPECGKEILYTSVVSFRRVNPNSKCRHCCNVIRGKSSNRKGCKHSAESKLKISKSQTGKKLSLDTRLLMSSFQKSRYSNPEELQKMANSVREAMHRPDVRKKHITALNNSKWLIVKTDVGQLEMLDKWNKLGFNFKPNYQLKTECDLFYIDGYDATNNVVLEYDGKYHNSIGQQKKDLVRQQKIIDILRPRKFWRYNSKNKSFQNVLGGISL